MFIVLGEVKKSNLYIKITGAQYVELFGAAKKHEMPNIWEELGQAGFESGPAYGKAYLYHQVMPRFNLVQEKQLDNQLYSISFMLNILNIAIYVDYSQHRTFYVDYSQHKTHANLVFLMGYRNGTKYNKSVHQCILTTRGIKLKDRMHFYI